MEGDFPFNPPATQGVGWLAAHWPHALNCTTPYGTVGPGDCGFGSGSGGCFRANTHCTGQPVEWESPWLVDIQVDTAGGKCMMGWSDLDGPAQDFECP